MTFEEWLQAKGFGGVTLTDAQTAALKAAFQAEQTPPPAHPPGDDPGRAAIEAARKREEWARETGTIIAAALESGRITSERAELIAAKAKAENWDRNKLQYEIILAGMPQSAPSPTRRDAVGDDVIEAAVAVAGGLENIDKHYKPEVLEAAGRQYRHGLHLSDLLMVYARRGGYAGTSVKANLGAALRAAFEVAPNIQAAGSWGPSTGGGLSGVLSNVANKFLRAGFESVDQGWRPVAATRSVSDFKAITTYSLTGGMTYEKVAPGGEIKHGQVGAETYTNQIDTYGRMIGLDRRDIINDDLGALTQVGRRLGRGGALKINDVFWTAFLNNSSFFTAGRNNLVTTNALSLAGLDAANAKFLTQTDPDGAPLGVMPKILLVPPGLWSTASTLMSSTSLVSGATTTPGTPSNNVWAGMFRVVTSPYMANATYTGYSATTWYLLADPMDMPTVEVAFLNGNETPTVETADADFGMLGIALRGYHDFGVSMQEYRGGVKNTA
jgi:phage major head subunit gpT-like protein